MVRTWTHLWGATVQPVAFTLISSGVLSLPKNWPILARLGVCMLPQSEFRPEGQLQAQRRPRFTQRLDVRVEREG